MIWGFDIYILHQPIELHIALIKDITHKRILCRLRIRVKRLSGKNKRLELLSNYKTVIAHSILQQAGQLSCEQCDFLNNHLLPSKRSLKMERTIQIFGSCVPRTSSLEKSLHSIDSTFEESF